MKPLDPLEVELTGLQLIEASAGTGKTFAITTLALRGVLQGIDISRILIVTFTNAATAELRRRLRERLSLALETYADPANPAADEDLRRLIQQRLAAGEGGADRRRVRAALDGFDEASIFTIHGFCQRALREFAFESGAAFDVELVGDPRPLLADAVRDVWAARLFGARRHLVAGLGENNIKLATVANIAGSFALHRDLRIVPPVADPAADEATVWTRNFLREVGPAVLETLQRRKEAGNVQDFDDLLHSLDRALRGPASGVLLDGLRRRYGLALIDEFQDTDPVQFRIFHALHTRGGIPLFLIGDPKQAIYAFRGADVFAYLDAQRGASDAHTLLTNWRSSPRLVQAVNALFTNLQDPFVLPEIRFRAGEAAAPNRDRLGGTAENAAPLRILFARRDELSDGRKRPTKPAGSGHWWYRCLADQVVELLDGGTLLDGRPVRPGDIAILCRKNDQLVAVSEALRAANVPSVALGDASVFESPEALMLEHLLRALAEPGDALALRVALVTPLLGLDSDAIVRLNADEAEWDVWGERFQRWNERWRSSGVTAALRGLFEEQEVPRRLLGRPGGERSMTNLLHLGELLQQAASESRRGPHGLVDWLHRMRVDDNLRRELGSEAAQVRLESDVHAVSLTTIHKSKGLQYPIVFCPFLWDHIDPLLERTWPRFHDAERHLAIDLNMPPADDSRTRRDAELRAEEMRLLYVALTRAQQMCVVMWCAINLSQHAALARLLHGVPARNVAAAPRDVKAIGQLTDDEMLVDLGALVAAADGAIALAPLPRPRNLRHVAAAADAAALVEPPRVPPVAQAWRIASFTSLSAGAEAAGLRAEEGIDRDEVAAEPDAATVAAALQGFPRGRGPGTLVHRILELVDFGVEDPAVLRALVERQLTMARIGREWIDPLSAALRDVLDTPLVAATPALRLRDVPRAQRLSEMEFSFPVVGEHQLTAARLAEAFDRHGGSDALRTYAERLRRLPFRPLAGFLRGYIDLVFAHGGRWYVVDYKSNDLGPTPAHYAPAALAAEMTRHDYVLQYHLYLVAVHRYLRRRLPDYAYQRHVGGALYLFVRGMLPARGPATGIVHATPPPALIEALSVLLGGAES